MKKFTEDEFDTTVDELIIHMVDVLGRPVVEALLETEFRGNLDDMACAVGAITFED